MKNIFPILLTLVLLSGCSKGIFMKSELGIMHDKTGMDGCGWMIESGGENMNPINIQDFDIALTEGMEVKFKYQAHAGASTCMAGKNIKLTSLKSN